MKNIKWHNIKIGEHNIVQYLHSATWASPTINKSAIWNSETLKQCNINSEIRNSATLVSATL